MKGNKGITLIALIVTIIVLIILAGVAIAMLRGDSGILNRASEARYDTILSSVDEQVKLAAINVSSSITSQKVSKQGYIATRDIKTGDEENDPNYFDALYKAVVKDLNAGSDVTNGFTVTKYLTDSTEDTTNGEGTGYILITYSNNALRASLPTSNGNVSGTTFNGIKYTNSGDISTNLAVVCYVIKVTNYASTLSKPAFGSSGTNGTVTALTSVGTKNAAGFEGTTLGAALKANI